MKQDSIRRVQGRCQEIVNVLSIAGSLCTQRFRISLDYWAVPSFILCRARSHSWHPSPSTVTQGNTHPLYPGKILQRMSGDVMRIFLASISTCLQFLIAMSRHTKEDMKGWSIRILGTSPLDLCSGITRPVIFKEDQFVVAVWIWLLAGPLLSVVVLSCVCVTQGQRRRSFDTVHT